MNILFDARTATPQFPGIGRYAAELVPALAELFRRTGDTLTVVCAPDYVRTLASDPNIIPVECTVAPDSPDSGKAINDIITYTRPDAYHTPHRLCHPDHTLPTVLTIHDCIPVRCPFENSPQKRIDFMTSVGGALRACTRAIAVSQTTLSDLETLFPDEASNKCTVIHHGIDPAFRPSSEAEQAVAGHACQYTRPTLLYIGNNLRHKNLMSLFHGFARAQQQMLHGVQLVLGGYGCEPLPRHTNLVEKLELNDSITWIGEVAEDLLPAVLGAATTFVMPSLYEGFGLPVLEAMACGTPVACSDIPAFREVCGDTATFFNPEDPDSIAQALVTAATDEIARARTRTAALERAHTFNWATAAEKTRNVYLEAVAAFKGAHPAEHA